MAVIYNETSNTLVTGTSDNDTIENHGSYATIKTGAGNDSVSNSTYGDDGANSLIDGGNGSDSIDNYADNVKIDGGDGNDLIYDDGWGVTINGGAGNDYINSGLRGESSINGGTGDDLIDSYGSDVTIIGGKGSDTIFNNCSNDYSPNCYDGYGENVLFKYSTGDGNDIIYGFNETSTLSIGGGSYSTEKSGDNIIVTVGDGKISLMGAATLDAVNITGTKGGGGTVENSWKLNGTTATYGTSSKTLVTVKGVKSLDGISLSGKKVKVAKSSLNASKVTLSGTGYTLALASDVSKPSTKKAWSLSGTTATYKQTTSAGYKLASNAKSITYTKKATKTLATVKGAKSKSGFTLSGTTLKLATNSLSKKVSVSSANYGFEFASTYKNALITGSGSSDTIINNGSNITIRGGKGDDYLTGGAGKETFVYSSGDGDDTITNFDAADRISIESGTANISTSGDDIIFTVGNGEINLQNAKGKTITYFDETGKERTYKQQNSLNDVKYNAKGTAVTLKATYNQDSFEPSDYEDYPNLATINAAAVENSLQITGNKKKNKITATSEDDTIYGGAGTDTLIGGAGNDELYGEKGNDSLHGGAGSDSLWGGAGDDILTGGGGADIFYYKDGDGNDTITDFNDSMDKIIVSASNIGFPEAINGDVTFKVGNGEILIKGGADKFIQLYGENGGELGRKYAP